MIYLRVLVPFIFLFSGATAQHSFPKGDWLGTLKIRPITYRIYLKTTEASSQLFVLNPKANEIPLDTLFFRNDSLHFKRGDFYSSYAGKFLKESNIIHGNWTDDGYKKHPVTFVPVNPDTVTGLHPKNSTAYSWKKPAIRKDGLTTCSLSDQNIRQNFLDSLTDKVMHEQYPNMHSILISRNGCLFYEEYFYGWKADDLWLIQSATKSFTSTLTGIALDDGELKNLDETICSHLPDYKYKACNEQNKSITLRQLLTMSSGLDWNELEYNYYDDRNTAVECGKAKDPFDFLLSRNKSPAGILFFPIIR